MVKGAVRWSAGVVSSVLILGHAGGTQQLADSTFAFFEPSVTLTAADRQRLDNDELVVKTLSGKGGQLAVFAATRLKLEPDAFLMWTRGIAELKRSKFVQAIQRFSDPPVLADFDSLALDQRDLDAIRTCQPGDCALKLPASDIESLRQVAATESDEAVQDEFRRLLLARVNLYRDKGLEGLPAPADGTKSAKLTDVFAAIMTSSSFLPRHLPNLAAWLQSYPGAASADVESFFYWSKEYYGSGKPVISVSHVGIVRPSGDGATPVVLVASKQIFATHYMNGALGLTVLLRGPTTDIYYLVYVNRSQIDLLKGFFAPVNRAVLQGRVKESAPQILGALRGRLESGPPPVATIGRSASAFPTLPK
jgi:hypothetical protein